MLSFKLNCLTKNEINVNQLSGCTTVTHEDNSSIYLPQSYLLVETFS